MLSKTLFAFTALFAVAFAVPIALDPRATDDLEERTYPSPPADWATNYLEPYPQYHDRYMALGCEYEHQNATFWGACCHPMLKTETLSDRPDYCDPDKVPDCDDSDSSDSTPAVTVTTTKTITTHTTTSSHKTTSTHHTTTTTKKAAATNAPASGAVQTGGVATYFYQNGNYGACGNKNSDSSKIAAIDQDRYGNSGLKSPLCGRHIQITNKNNGKTVVVQVADDCPSCDNANSIDLSVGAFTAIATEEEGEVPITWYFMD